MLHFVLLVMLVGFGGEAGVGKSVALQEFNEKSDCEWAVKMVQRDMKNAIAMCLPKQMP